MNTLRYVGTPGHVESYFLRANHPSRPLAFWVKLTVLAPLVGDPVVETWFIAFDGETGSTFAHRDTHPLDRHALAESLAAGTYRFDLLGGRLVGQAGSAAFNLSFTPSSGPIGASVSIFPFGWMLTAPFPKSKLVTPVPTAAFVGTVDCFGQQWTVDGWLGMQGHNWGKEHAPEYAWGQCIFPGGEPTMVEGFTGRIRLGSRLSPRLSALVVRRGEREYRFDTIVDLWRQEATITEQRWTLRMRGRDGEARLRMDASGRPMACLGYGNPDGRLSYCFNSKLADTLLEVSPRGGADFRCQSAHGGALELLRSEPDPAIPVLT